MKVLIACEYSGTVRDCFIERGHDAVSCDLLPTEKPGPHICGDVLGVLREREFDLLIAHPPCTFLTVAANGWLKRPGRLEAREDAFQFFMRLYNSSIPKICVENPVGYVNSAFRKPDQIIHPFFFGDPEKKRTCLWLKGLPKLQPTSMVEPETPMILKNGKKCYFVDKQSPSKDRWKIRSKTFLGIAKAMASQWG